MFCWLWLTQDQSLFCQMTQYFEEGKFSSKEVTLQKPVSKPAVLVLSNTNRRQLMWSSKMGALMVISSKYTRQCVQLRPMSTKWKILIKGMKIAGLFVDPKGITLHWNWTLWALMSWEGSLRTILLFHSHLPVPRGTHWTPPKGSNTSSVRCSGMVFFFVNWLSVQYSM